MPDSWKSVPTAAPPHYTEKGHVLKPTAKTIGTGLFLPHSTNSRKFAIVKGI